MPRTEGPQAESHTESVVAVLDSGRVRTESIVLEPPEADEIDVDVTLAALCGSDIHTVQGHRPSEPLTALGHEGVGRVRAARAGTTDLRGDPLRPGDRVAMAMITSCGHCDRCGAGLPMKCRTVFKYGHRSIEHPPHASGMLATVVRILPGTPVVRIPDEVPDQVMVSAGCAVATAAAALRVAAVGTGDRIGVLGAGAVGWYVAAMARSRGCEVLVVEPDPQRRDLASRLGATATADPQELSRFEPVAIIEASGHPQAVTDAMAMAPIGGRVVCVGSVSPGATTITVDPAVIVTRWLTLLGVHNYDPRDFGDAVDWLVTHADRVPAELVSPPYGMDQLDEAVEMMVSGRHPRVAVAPG